MTIDNFLQFFNGIYADYDGAYGDQCFDLANLYSRWIGGQRFYGATADLIFNQPGDFYIQIPNNPDNYPLKGDIVIWDWPHVGIATGKNTDINQFEVLEQNDPVDSNCHIKIYNYSNHVKGWLHPKIDNEKITQPIAQIPLTDAIISSQQSQTVNSSVTSNLPTSSTNDSIKSSDFLTFLIGYIKSKLGIAN